MAHPEKRGFLVSGGQKDHRQQQMWRKKRLCAHYLWTGGQKQHVHTNNCPFQSLLLSHCWKHRRHKGNNISEKHDAKKTDCCFLACIYLKNGAIMWHQVRISHVVNLNGKLLVWGNSILWKNKNKKAERSETFPNCLMH